MIDKKETFPVRECDRADQNAGKFNSNNLNYIIYSSYALHVYRVLNYELILATTHGIWVLENGELKIHEKYLNDWSTLRELLFTYADENYSLRKDTWEWIVRKAENTYVSNFRSNSCKKFENLSSNFENKFVFSRSPFSNMINICRLLSRL